jgi:hypothetical protein
MGLDVYLHRYDDLAAYEKLAKEEDEFSKKAWDIGKPYDQMTQAEKDACSAKTDQWRKDHGFEGDDPPGRKRIDLPSTTDSKHIFRIGYFRSSYNDGGLNTYMRHRGLPDLYSIFPEANQKDAYRFVPDWEAALERTHEAIGALNTHAARSGKLAVMSLDMNPFGGPPGAKLISSEQEALESCLEMLEGRAGLPPVPDDESIWYTGWNSRHFVKPHCNVVALYLGKTDNVLARLRPGEPPTLPAVYVVYENDIDPNDFYLKALAIVAETCEYVLQQPRPEQYALSWSG